MVSSCIQLKLFLFQVKLLAHIKVVHRGEKGYSCSYCQRTFSTKFNQLTHEGLKHTGSLVGSKHAGWLSQNLQAGWIKTYGLVGSKHTGWLGRVKTYRLYRSNQTYRLVGRVKTCRLVGSKYDVLLLSIFNIKLGSEFQMPKTGNI